MKQINTALLDELTARAQQSPRLRAHHNMHPQLVDPTQRLAVAMEPGTYVRAHRHPHTFELLHSLRGRFVVLHFNDAGEVTDRVVLGEETKMVETPAGAWHAVLSLDEGAVIFEVKDGEYTPIPEEDYMPWTVAEGEPGMEAIIAWYATAQVGDRFPGL